MSTEKENARLIAERIARRMSALPTTSTTGPATSPGVSAELAAVRASLSDLQEKLAQIEAKMSGDTRVYPLTSSHTAASRPAPFTHSPWLAGVNSTAAHPSEERFGVEEAVVSELVDFFEKEKSCSLEPGGKPCDHCSMCSSRGF